MSAIPITAPAYTGVYPLSDSVLTVLNYALLKPMFPNLAYALYNGEILKINDAQLFLLHTIQSETSKYGSLIAVAESIYGYIYHLFEDHFLQADESIHNLVKTKRLVKELVLLMLISDTPRRYVQAFLCPDGFAAAGLRDKRPYLVLSVFQAFAECPFFKEERWQTFTAVFRYSHMSNMTKAERGSFLAGVATEQAIVEPDPADAEYVSAIFKTLRIRHLNGSKYLEDEPIIVPPRCAFNPLWKFRNQGNSVAERRSHCRVRDYDSWKLVFVIRARVGKSWQSRCALSRHLQSGPTLLVDPPHISLPVGLMVSPNLPRDLAGQTVFDKIATEGPGYGFEYASLIQRMNVREARDFYTVLSHQRSLIAGQVTRLGPATISAELMESSMREANTE